MNEIKLFVESVRSKLSGRRDTPSTSAEGLEPVCEESPTRKLFAPSPWLCGITDVGKCRSNNEDEFFLSAEYGLWVVADGMGGQAAGEVASTLTVQAIVESVTAMRPASKENAAVCAADRLIEAFGNAQDKVSLRSLDTECSGMGSTAIAALLEGDALHICHVGDVRCYHFDGTRSTQVTHDHSWVWENLVMSGLLSAEQGRSHPERGKVTRAIGRQQGINPDLTSITLKPGDRVLLCTDGLWEALSSEEIAAILRSEGSMRQLASVLADRANAAGGEDNITVVLYEHGHACSSS